MSLGFYFGLVVVRANAKLFVVVRSTYSWTGKDPPGDFQKVPDNEVSAKQGHGKSTISCLSNEFVAQRRL